MPSDFWPEDPLRNNEAHQAWKAAREKTFSSQPLKEVLRPSERLQWANHSLNLVICMGCGAVFDRSAANQHELEWH